jgi:hypothetical protein
MSDVGLNETNLGEMEITPPGQEGWLCHKKDLAKQPLMAQTGWWINLEKNPDQPPRRFAPPLLARRGD